MQVRAGTSAPQWCFITALKLLNQFPSARVRGACWISLAEQTSSEACNSLSKLSGNSLPCFLFGMPAIPNSQLGFFPVWYSWRETQSPFIWGHDAPAGGLVGCESLCERGLAVLPSVLRIQPLTQPSAATGDGCK